MAIISISRYKIGLSLMVSFTYLPYYLAKLILKINFIIDLFALNQVKKRSNSHLCIEAGPKGWESIEFKELLQSATEYLGPDCTHKLVVSADEDYIEQVSNAIQKNGMTHYLYDPRTGSQSLLKGLLQSYQIGITLQRNKVVPIVLLTDLSVRIWRIQASIVSAVTGVVVCFMAPTKVGHIFPHSRLLGPSLMPFSTKTLRLLDVLIDEKPKNLQLKCLFIGSLYEPRTTILKKIQSGLEKNGIEFIIKGRHVGSKTVHRVSDLEYWSELCRTDIVLTTADQMIQSGTDLTHVPHLIYRYLEVLASGALLVANSVPSVERYFKPGTHFVSYNSPEEAVEKIAYYSKNEVDRIRVAEAGRLQAKALINSRTFWMLIDTFLSSDSLL